ncbi:DMT family transporter [Solirubrobacter soli]|uniref:DMT family transporter n=1 Tax=Solirubrobacter soli TaxID=363832 RepID=UPI00069E9875|nr:EamA family transporter [Solirubrobacter soli]
MLFSLGSGAAFGAMAVFGKLAYGEGATVGTLLAVRFALAAALFWAAGAAARAWRARDALDVPGRTALSRPAVAAPPHPRRPAPSRPAVAGPPHPRRPAPSRPVVTAPPRPAVAGPPHPRLSRRDVLAGLALGAGGYALQAGCYFAALQRIDASLLALLVYTFPGIVAVAAIALGRERADSRRLAALVVALGGLALLVAGGAGALDPLGAALGMVAAVTYSAYILVSEGIARRVRPHVLAALVCTGAAIALTAGSLVLGDLRPGELTAAGWGWLAALAAISTVGAIGLFFAGLARVGPTTASILATVEPLVTVLLAFLVFSETLTQLQLGGGALVLAAAATIGRMST